MSLSIYLRQNTVSKAYMWWPDVIEYITEKEHIPHIKDDLRSLVKLKQNTANTYGMTWGHSTLIYNQERTQPVNKVISYIFGSVLSYIYTCSYIQMTSGHPICTGYVIYTNDLSSSDVYWLCSILVVYSMTSGHVTYVLVMFSFSFILNDLRSSHIYWLCLVLGIH